MIRRLSNCRLYVDGIEGTGLCESFNLPEVEIAQVEYGSLGMAGVVELPASVQKMEASAVWLHQPPEISQLMHNPIITSQIQLRSEQATFNSLGEPVSGLYTALLRVRPKMMKGGNFTQGEATKPETTFAVDYYSLTVNGQTFFEVDAISNSGIRVNGELINLVGR
ncbi:phage major tail tube protein [Geminocystis sp. NIES-3709]|uniref:phage major tail tube protein n=1 Tax=Geminocystis sp. NIES-3709 TaxID=1617448 RepID=UPI0005FCB4BF|nr:phage major tail tube protein [Geminocystis sp. NIES-3709]BAQ65521.1 putative phage tail core protein [Geminocystis sp. NIES-3709]